MGNGNREPAGANRAAAARPGPARRLPGPGGGGGTGPVGMPLPGPAAARSGPFPRAGPGSEDRSRGRRRSSAGAVRSLGGALGPRSFFYPLGKDRGRARPGKERFGQRNPPGRRNGAGTGGAPGGVDGSGAEPAGAAGAAADRGRAGESFRSPATEGTVPARPTRDADPRGGGGAWGGAGRARVAATGCVRGDDPLIWQPAASLAPSSRSERLAVARCTGETGTARDANDNNEEQY